MSDTSTPIPYYNQACGRCGCGIWAHPRTGCAEWVFSEKNYLLCKALDENHFCKTCGQEYPTTTISTNTYHA
jgi:hypothetical protein